MPTVKEIAKAIEDFAPRHLQEDFDNAGLQVGDPDMEVKEILVCLDVTEEILDEAIAKQCNLIVTHHTLIFGGIKEITGRNLTQKSKKENPS
jgi:putative NIF3 family GTP cyclohydrolase 1 type 2